jgi:hypothetical protein
MPTAEFSKMYLDPLGPGMAWRVASDSRTGKYHIVFASESGAGVQCSCEGWQFRGNCKHVQSIPLCKAVAEASTIDGALSVTYYNDPCGLPEGHRGDHSWERRRRGTPDDPFKGLTG